ncbi:MAG: tRNA lysidine(34) synthetase TilS, partial [Dehalococcoidia bacterium]|nr:tRNA lysidine(34) synthetase TilS [Dehalococcoidia bacterium]
MAGVSGGPDSTLLIRCLAHLQGVLDIRLSIAHYDHGLRSRAEAQDDSDYVAGLAKDLDLPFTIGRGQVRKEARARRMSVEETARRLRYAFLATEARRLKAQAVTVGHTSSDQAETVLLHIMRGSGLRGVAAMSPRSSWPTGEGPDLVRPLLDLSRDDSLRYCAEEVIKPRIDPSNSSLNADRNRVRLQLMPELSKFNPRVERALCRLATAATIDSSYLDTAAEAIWPTLAREKDGVTTLDRPRLAKLEQAIAFRVLRLAARRLAKPAIELTTRHLAALAETLHKQRASVSLPGALTATLEGDNLLITR